MRRALLLLALVAGLVQPAPPASADIAYPARLDIVEAAPGTYDITFTLPIVRGRLLRAEPQLPPTCNDVSTREESTSSVGLTTAWTVECEPPSLAGETILVQGLLGTQTDLAVTLATLGGRVHSEILRPSRPGFLVPEPPSLSDLAAEATVAGMRRTLRQLPLWLLLLVAALLGVRRRGLVAGAAALACTHALAQWLGQHGWLQVGLPERDLFVLVTVAVPCAALAGAGERWRGWVRPLWPATALLGLLYGGAAPDALPVGGLSDLEQLLAIGLFAAGVALGLLLMALAAIELEAVLKLSAGGRWRERADRWLGTAIGALAVGMLLSQIAALPLDPADARIESLELALLAAVLGPSLVAAGRGTVESMLSFAVLTGAGLAAGLAPLPLPLGSTLVVGTLSLLGLALAANRPLSGRWVLAIGAVAVPTHAWFVSQGLVENVSRSTGASVGAAVLALCVLYAGLTTTRGMQTDVVPPWARLFGAGVALQAVVLRLGEYFDWFDREIATELALGLIRIPLLALLLGMGVLLVWPRRRRVLDELGLERRRRMTHWALLVAAWVALPFGTVSLSNPLFEPHAPSGEEARRVAARVLSDTYHAFNIADENELYDRLAESVTGDLIEDLYLDSRRRLTAGTREGAQVTVREVSVLEIGQPQDNGEIGYAYDCRWAVTARVQHLQHVHHRRNVYNGALTLRLDGDRWKIAGVELTSEERVVVR